MKALRYKAIVDGNIIWESNSIKRCKEKADIELSDTFKGYFARIVCGKRDYASRFYDTKWVRHY